MSAAPSGSMPQFGFFFDGRFWWAVYGQLVVISASDPVTLREQLPHAVRRARESAGEKDSGDR